MKPMIEKTKTRASHISVRTLALVLCFVMLIGAIGAGTVLTAIAQEFEPSGDAVLAAAAVQGADVTLPATDDESGSDGAEDIAAADDTSGKNIVDKITSGFREKIDLAYTGAYFDVASTGDTDYYFYVSTNGGQDSSFSSSLGPNTAQYSVASGSNYYIRVSTSDSDAFAGDINFTSENLSTTVDASTANTSSLGSQECWHGGTSYKSCRVSFQTAGTMYLSYDGSKLTISSNATNINGGSSGTGASGMGTEVTVGSNLENILKKTYVEFYCQTYYGNNTATLKNSSGTALSTSATDASTSAAHYIDQSTQADDKKWFWVYISNSDKANYYYITNNTTWGGNANTAINSATGGEFFDGRNTNNTIVSGKPKTTATTTLNTTTFTFAETLIFSTSASSTKSSYGEDLVYRYYIKTGGVTRQSGDKYYHLDIADVAASTTAQLSGVDLFKYEPGTYTLITLGNDGKIDYILDEDEFTVTELPASASAPTWKEASNSIIFNLKASAEQIHLWNTTAPSGNNPRTPTGNKSYNDGTTTRYLSYLEGITTASGNTPGAIAYHNNNLIDANKYTGDITGGTHNSEEVYYFYSDDTPSKSVTGQWTPFDHITSTLKVNNSTDPVEIGLNGSVTINNTPGGTLATADKSGASTAKYIYYVVRPNGTVNKVNSTWVSDTSFIFEPDEVGTYKVFCWVQDMWGYETRVSDNDMIIKVLQDYNVVTKTNDKNLGTVSVNKSKAVKDQKVTITVSENCGNFTGLSVKDASGNAVSYSPDFNASTFSYTFDMPEKNVTVKATFAAVEGTSDWYYNGYDNSYNELYPSNGDMYAKRMSLGKIGGQTYSYYQVQNRVDNQVFTISYGDLSDTNYVYFIQNDGWTDHHGWDADPQVQFLSSDGSKLKDWATMTYDDKDSSDDAWKAKVPIGAHKVQFRACKNDPNTSAWPYTTVQDLYDDVNKNCYYLSGYDNNQQNQSQIATKKRGNDPAIANSHEKFYGDSVMNYLSASDADTLVSANGFQKQTGTHGGSHDYVKPSSLGDSSGNYYIIVLHSGGNYTINGKSTGTLTANKVIWMDKLPGFTDEEEENTVDVYAKDGAAPINWNAKTTGGASDLTGTAYNYAAIAKTTIVTIDGVAPETGDVDTVNVGNASSQYEYAKITPGSTINIKTTIDSSYRSRFYVRGFCVNGVTYYGGQNGVENYSRINDTPDTTTGEYTLTYTIPADQTEPVEITPIYYYVPAQVPAGVDIVTFYLQGYTEEIQTNRGWGNTPYIYPFYGNLNNVDNAFGCYPGQPMVYVNGSYSIDVPVKNLSINTSDTDYNTTFIKGITISNGYADYVHKVKIYNWSQGSDNSDPDHMQTYDYDDFIKIYHEKTKEIDGTDQHPNTITFRMKDESADFQAKTYGGLAKNSQRVYNNDENISDKLSSIENGWEDLTNFFNENVDLFGDKVTNNNLDPIYVVSTGYNANIAGDYGTAWMIYNSAGTSLLSNDSNNDRYAVPPSIFLLRWNTSTSNFTYLDESPIPYTDANHSVSGAGSYTDSISKYKTLANNLYNNSDVKGHPVKIAYEKNTQDIRDKELGTGAHRMDGRWYYTFSDDTVQSDIQIEYYNTSTGAYVAEDNYTGTTGTSTGVASITDFANPCTAMFTGTGVSASDVRKSGEQRMKTGTYQFTVTGATGWTLEGLYLKYDNTYHKIVGGKTGNTTIPAEVNATIVARFDPTNSGTLTINHNVLGTSKGSGTATVSAVVNTGSTTVTFPASGTASSVLIPDTYISNANSEYTITVTLTGTGTLDDTFNAFGYDSFNNAKGITATQTPAVIAANTTTATSTFTFKVGDLYSGGGKQTTKSLTYTSSFNATPHYYEFVYQYPSRGSATNDKSYTVRGTFSSDDYDTYVTVGAGDVRTVSEAFIKNIAPYQSNFNQDLSVYLAGSSIAQSGGTNGYNSETKVHKATITYAQSASTYKAVFALPYNIVADNATTDGTSAAAKKYTGLKTATTINGVEKSIVRGAATTIVPFDGITYENFVTNDGTQSSVSKDSETPNHVNNKFITAPDKIAVLEVVDGVEVYVEKYFSYWQIYDYNDYKNGKEIEDMAEVAEVYYPDFNYRIYCDYYIVPVYGAAEDSFLLKFTDEDTKSAKIVYLGDSRNQWNTPSAGTQTSSEYAADIIYNDFAVAYNYQGKELINLSFEEKAKYKIGMFIERVKDSNGNYVKGDTSVDDMSYYKDKYGLSAEDQETKSGKIKQYLEGTLEGSLGFAAVNVNNWEIDDTLNEKNRGEKYYYFTSQKGQTVEDHSIEFTNDSTVDDYVYRAYAYLIYDDGESKEVILSEPVYFSMRCTANK